MVVENKNNKTISNQKINMYCKQTPLEKILGLTPKNSFDAIAAELGVTKQTVWEIYNRALEKIAPIVLELKQKNIPPSSNSID